MAALHRIQWIDAEIRADAYPNARRVAERFEVSHRQGQRDFEYLRDSLGAPLVYSAHRRGYRYQGETYVLPGQFVTPRQRGVLGNLARYYARSAQRRDDPVLSDVATLFARLSGSALRASRPPEAGGESAPDVGLPFLATLSVPGRYFMLDMERLGVPVPEAMAPFHRGGQGPQRVNFEFRSEDTEAFVSALLGAWPPFRVEHPRWLQERVLLRLDELRSTNAAVAADSRGAGTTRHVVPAALRSNRDEVTSRSQAVSTVKVPVSAPEGAPERRSASVDARLQPNWTSFVGAVEGVLRAAALIDEQMDRSQLMGLTGRAFHLTLDESAWPGCPTMYDWQREHVEGLERVGVLAEAFHASPDSPSYDAARRRAVTHVKASLDRGIGVILWGVDVPEFGVVNGYDDADGVFLVDGVARMNHGSSTPILYENVGRTSDVPELHYVVPVERIPWDEARSHRAALAVYVERMERKAPSGAKHQTGLGAYDTWLTALERSTFIPFGLRYNTVLYGDSKIQAAAYFSRLASDGLDLPGLLDVAALAEENAGLFRKMQSVLGMDGPSGSAHLGQPVSEEQAKGLAGLVREARRVERRQVELTKRALAG